MSEIKDNKGIEEVRQNGSNQPENLCCTCQTPFSQQPLPAQGILPLYSVYICGHLGLLHCEHGS